MIVHEETDIGEDGEYVRFTIKAKSNDFTEFVNNLGAIEPAGQYEIVFENEAWEDEGSVNNNWSYFSIKKDGVALSYLNAPFIFIGSDYSSSIITNPVTIEIIPVYK